MKFPAWPDFTKKVSELEENIRAKLQSFKENHPVLEGSLKESFSFLPSPFNTIAEKIYNTASGSEQEKSDAVVKYFQDIIDQGEDHYSKITLQLETILSNIEDIKAITAKESTLSNVQQILISSGQETHQNLITLKNDIASMTVKVDTIVDSTAKIIRRSDKILSMLEGKEYDAHIDQTGNTIHFKIKDKVVETINSADLSRLDYGSQQLIKAFEQSMQINFNIFVEVYPQLALADPMTKARLKVELRPVINQMCSDLENIFRYLNSLGKQLHDHYANIRYACDKAKSDLEVVDTVT